MTAELADTSRVILQGGRVIDGCGNPWVRADIYIEGDTISEIAACGHLRHGRRARGVRIIDVEDRYVTPGFIDVHTHSDLTILSTPDAEGILRQGVTTHVTGNCGMSPAPLVDGRREELVRQWQHYWDVSGVPWSWRSFDEYLEAVEDRGPGINIVPLVGHGTLRLAAMGYEHRRPTAREMTVMKRLLRQSMAAGAFGLSSGLVYPPGCYADTVELVELASLAAACGGIYASHVRGERETILDAVREAIDIGAQAGLPVEVSHNAPKWGGPHASENLAVIEAARARGQDVTLDNDTHTDLAPRLSLALPQPVIDQGHEALMTLLADGTRRSSLKRQIVTDALPGAGYSGLLKHARLDRVIVLAATNEHLLGRSIVDIARERSQDALDTYLDLILEEDDKIVAIFDYIDARDIEQVLSHPLTMVSSDGEVTALPPVDSRPVGYTPCSFAEHARVLAYYVRDRQLLGLEDAVRRMSSYPAQRMGLWDRGTLRPGLRADVAVFDLAAVADRATNVYPHSYPFDNIPPQYAEGMDYVFVNGTLAIDAGQATGRLAGRVLRRRSGTTGRRPSRRARASVVST